MNWGHKITIAIVLFMGFMSYLAYKSFQQNIDLVTEDYYEQEIHYQQQMDKIRQTKDHRQRLTFSQQADRLVIQFPEETNAVVKGTISLFRPSDARFDQEVAIQLNENGQQLIPTQALAKGHYRVKVDWTAAQQAYFMEETVFIH